MFCPYCGKKLKNESKYCRFCGKSIFPKAKFFVLGGLFLTVLLGGLFFGFKKQSLKLLVKLGLFKDKIEDIIEEEKEEKEVEEKVTFLHSELEEPKVRLPYFVKIETKYLETSRERVEKFVSGSELIDFYTSVDDWENPDTVPYVAYTFLAPGSSKTYQVRRHSTGQTEISEKEPAKSWLLKTSKLEFPPELRVAKVVRLAMAGLKKLYPKKEVRSISVSSISTKGARHVGLVGEHEIWKVIFTPKNPKPAEYHEFYVTESLVIYKPRVKYTPKPKK